MHIQMKYAYTNAQMYIHVCMFAHIPHTPYYPHTTMANTHTPSEPPPGHLQESLGILKSSLSYPLNTKSVFTWFTVWRLRSPRAWHRHLASLMLLQNTIERQGKTQNGEMSLSSFLISGTYSTHEDITLSGSQL